MTGRIFTFIDIPNKYKNILEEYSDSWIDLSGARNDINAE